MLLRIRIAVYMYVFDINFKLKYTLFNNNTPDSDQSWTIKLGLRLHSF